MPTTPKEWPQKAKPLAIELHNQLKITNQSWHQLKNNSNRRTAELLSGAMVQLLNNGKASDIEELILQSIKWLKKEIKDPGCPNHDFSKRRNAS